MAKEKGLKSKVQRLIYAVTDMKKNIINLIQANGNSACELSALKKILIEKGVATEDELLKGINNEIEEFNKHFEVAEKGIEEEGNEPGC